MIQKHKGYQDGTLKGVKRQLFVRAQRGVSMVKGNDSFVENIFRRKMCGGFVRAQRGVSINRESGVLMGGGCDSGPPQRSSKGVYYMPDWNTGDATPRKDDKRPWTVRVVACVKERFEGGGGVRTDR